MNSRAGIVIAAVGAWLSVPVTGPAVLAQMTMQPTPRPVVTADNETWYRAGIPITSAGNTYYPTGPLVYFNANEMVRSGHFEGVPLYSRTTIEPYSLVFVPLAGGLMQPYERRRSGELADSVGSATPSFPVVRAAEQAGMEYVPGAGMIQAPAPPSLTSLIDEGGIEPAQPSPAVSTPIGTTGTEVTLPRGPLTTAQRPEGLNGIFIEYDSQRYFADGRAVSFDDKLFTRIGEYRGFAVYRQRGDDKTVYIPPLSGTPTLVAPYRVR
jgi:hypothetical protein